MTTVHHENIARDAQATVEAVEDFWAAGSTDSFMVKAGATAVFRSMRNAWMVARSCKSVAESGSDIAGLPQNVQEHLQRIRDFVARASKADLEGDSATVDRAAEAINQSINTIEHEIAGPMLERHILAEWIGALKEIDARRNEVVSRQFVFDEQIRRWENVDRMSFGASETYTKEAKAAKRRTLGWTVGAGLLAAFTVVYGFYLAAASKAQDLAVGDALYMSSGRWVAFAVLIGAVTWCGRRASANAHLAAIARDRASAWDSYHVLVASGGPAAEAASALAAKLFDTPATGYLAKAAPSSIPSVPWRGDG